MRERHSVRFLSLPSSRNLLLWRRSRGHKTLTFKAAGQTLIKWEMVVLVQLLRPVSFWASTWTGEYFSTLPTAKLSISKWIEFKMLCPYLLICADCWYLGLSSCWPSTSPARSFSQVTRPSWSAGQLCRNRTKERPAPITWIRKDVASDCLNVSSCTHNWQI